MAEVLINIKAADSATPTIEALLGTLGTVSGALEAINDPASEVADAISGWPSLDGLSTEISATVAPLDSLVVEAGSFGQALDEAAGSWPELAGSFGELSLSVDDGALDALDARLGALQLDKALALDVTDAVTGASEVVAALAAIPDVTQKSVVIEYQTMASPIRPFTEGIGYVKDKMESLPGEGTYTVKYAIEEPPVAQDVQVSSQAAQQTAAGESPATAQASAAQQAQPAPGVADTAPAAQPAGEAASYTQAITFAPTVTINHQTTSGGVAGDARAMARTLDEEFARMWRTNRSELRREILR